MKPISVTDRQEWKWFLVVLKNPKSRFPGLVGLFPKKEQAVEASTRLITEGLRKGESVEILNALNHARVRAPEPGYALNPTFQRKNCAVWLRNYLMENAGLVVSEVLRAAANQAGFSDWTLRHASKNLGVVRFRKGRQRLARLSEEKDIDEPSRPAETRRKRSGHMMEKPGR